MSYSNQEKSVQSGAPIELYVFSRGHTFWRFTSFSEEYKEGLTVYSPESIERDNISQTAELSKGGISISFPISNEFASSYLGYVPEKTTLVTIYRLHRTDTNHEKISYWKGRVLSVKADGKKVMLECESIFSSLKRTGLRARYERSCRHTIFDNRCNVSIELYRLAGTVQYQSSSLITVTGISAMPTNYYAGGMAKDIDGNYRFIVANDGYTVTISRPFGRSILTEEIILYPGCDKTMTTCVNKFDNILNYGGFPWIPNKNPFDGGIT